MKHVAIAACSNGQKTEYSEQNETLVRFLESNACQVSVSDCLYERESIFPGTPQERAEALMQFYRDPEMEEIYDISGGDIANGILPYLDFDLIRKSRAEFWGYSDLTTVLNAIFAKAGKPGVLWQVKHMVMGGAAALQKSRYLHREELFSPSFSFVQGEEMQGIVIGGNIRCFLKLAGTEYMPDMDGKILLLEAMGGEVPQMAAFLAQLDAMGAFRKVNGILLGTFTAMERNSCTPDMQTLVKRIVPAKMPIAVTREVGHAEDAKAIFIGKEIHLIKGAKETPYAL